MNIDLPLVLTLLVLVTGLISLYDVLFLAKKRRVTGTEKPWPVDYARSFFPVLLLVLVVRSFVIQPYRVPTGSLEPTVLPGDFIAVSQYAYGLHLPVLHYKVMSVNEPKVGDLALFYWPVDPSKIFVKRVIGAPGDHVVYKNKVLTINGRVEKQKVLGPALDVEPGQPPINVQKRIETLNGVKHGIYVRPDANLSGDFDVIVPKGHYFMMGDNRDDSDDSRYWGFVPAKNLIGKPLAILFSWDANKVGFRRQRVFKRIH